jgi:amidase
MQAPAIFTMPPCNNFTLHEATIDQLQSAYASGRLSAEKVVQCYLDRIQQTNGWLKYVNQPMRSSDDAMRSNPPNHVDS